MEKGDFQDQRILCADCGGEFVWSAGEQLFYHDKGLQFPPKRCKPCKEAKKARVEGGARTAVPGQTQYEVTCASCNRETTVPFEPRQGRPVYCRDCFKARSATA